MEKPTREQLEKGKRFLDRLAQSDELIRQDRKRAFQSQAELTNAKPITDYVN